MSTAISCEQAGTTHRLSGSMVYLLGRVSQRSHQLTHELLAEHGIRKWHYGTMAVLAEFGPSSQTEIGQRLGLDRGDLVAVLNDLEREDYLRRSPDPANRRRNIVTLTAAGRKALTRFDSLVIGSEDLLLAALSPDERHQLARLLERVISHKPNGHA